MGYNSEFMILQCKKAYYIDRFIKYNSVANGTLKTLQLSPPTFVFIYW
jgi:hypothetical protein